MANSPSLLFYVQTVTAVFFGRYNLSDKLSQANILHQAVKNTFDGDPILFPIPNNAPNEIPQIILTSKNQIYQSVISLDRIIITYNEKGLPDKELGIISNSYLGILKDFTNVLKVQWKTNIERLGLVVNLISFTEEPAELIMKNYIRDGSIKYPKQIEVHNLNQIQLNELDINRWCRLSSTNTNNSHGERKALRVILDLNTIPHEDSNLTKDAIISFYDNAFKHSSDSLNLLFPIS